MKTYKLGTAIVGSFLAFGLLAACSPSETTETTEEETSQPTEQEEEMAPATDDEPIRLAVFELATANAYSQKNMEGVRKAAEELGNVEFDVFDGAFDGAKQLQQVQDALATGRYQGLLVFPNDSVGLVPGAQEAAADGIPVVAAYAPIGTDLETGEPQVDGVVGTVWHPNRPSGAALGELTAAACKEEHADADPCLIAYLSGGNSVLFEQQKLEAFKEVMDASGVNYEIVAQQEGNFLVDVARTATENILQANENLDVIATSADQMTIGAEQALTDAGRTGVTLVSVGGSLEGVEAVKAGRWFGTTVFLPVDEGYLATMMLVDAIRGNAISDTDINVLDGSPIGVFFSRDTEGEFAAQWSAVG